MKKKVLAILLSAMMLSVMLLTGCGGTGGNSQSNGGGDEKEVLTVMAVGTEADVYVDAYRAVAERFSADNEYGVEVKMDFYENEQYKTKLTTLMASNSVTDVFFTWELSYLQPFVEGGKVADITSYLEEDTQWRDSFAEGTLELCVYDGKNYGIPTQKSICVMFYNKQIFEDNGLEIPTTYEEFLEACATLKENGVTPMAMSGVDAWIPAQFVQQIAGGMAGDQLFRDICDGKEQWNNDTHIRAAEEAKKMADAEYFQSGYIGMGPEEAKEIFMNGNAAMYFMGIWESGNIQDSPIGEHAGAFVMPAYDAQYNNISVGSVDTTYAIAENSKNKEAAVAFLKYWTSEETQEELLYEIGRIPGNKNVTIDDSRLDPLMVEVLEASNEQVGLTPWWDRQFGAGEGVEFNNTCVAVLGGEDAKTAFDALQKFAEDNAKR